MKRQGSDGSVDCDATFRGKTLSSHERQNFIDLVTKASSRALARLSNLRDKFLRAFAS